ncbi:AraC-type DNA-binding protein [Bradyrhizobium erythrophlei]|uniref:AraC-type DNA-binding protein n=2 Tax=Bradyrhizobium erythrophlei TaxID=1437360 RepID=A0A1H4YWY5_9BRAD|nr:AraC-type DNA-binding protein [Bradyrhizobium erythrophlei]
MTISGATLTGGHSHAYPANVAEARGWSSTPAPRLSDRLVQASTSEPQTTNVQSTMPCKTVKTRRTGFAGELPHAREVMMRVPGSSAFSESPTQFLPLEPGPQTTAPEPSFAADQHFHLVANSLVELLETARRELERDRELAKASLITASHILHTEIERCCVANGCPRGGLAAWQIARLQAYIDSNLHRTLHIRNLSAVARRSPAHFCRQFKMAFGEPPHAYVVRRRLERACHLMMISAASLSEIALSVGFSDQAHLCRLFRKTFGQSPASWRRERGIPGEVTSRAGADMYL